MKSKLALASTIATIALGAAFGKEAVGAVMGRLLAHKAKEVITAQLVQEAAKSYGFNFGKNQTDFQRLYFQARSSMYNHLEVGDNQNTTNLESDDTFFDLRTIVAASMKQQLHKGDTMLEVYGICRPELKKQLAAESLEFNNSLLEVVKHARHEFNLVEYNLAYRQAVVKFKETKVWSCGRHELRAELLEQGLSAEEIAQAFLRQDSFQRNTPAPKAPKDMYLTEFVLRRLHDGPAVMKIYNQLLALVEQDVTEVLAGKK